MKLRETENHEIQFRIGIASLRRSEYNSALVHLNAALSTQDDKSQQPFSIKFALGVCYHYLNQHEKAITIFSNCLELLRRNSSKTIYEGHTFYWLGKSYYEMLDFSKATESMLSSLTLYNENRNKVKDQVIHKTLHLLGNTHFRNKQLKLALKCYEEEIALCNERAADVALGSSSLSEAYFCAGSIHAKRGKFEEASDYFEKSLETRKRFEGESNEKVAKILNRLGTVYLRKNEFTKAKETLTDAHNLLHKIYGLHDSRTISIEFKLAQTLDHLRAFGDAFHHYEQCLEGRRINDSQDNEETAMTLFYMGKNAFARLKVDESIGYFEEVSKTYGLQNP